MSHENHMEHNDKSLTIIINNQTYQVSTKEMTGLQIKQLAGAPSNYLLSELHGNGEEKAITDTQVVHLHKDLKFRIVNPPTFG